MKNRLPVFFIMFSVILDSMGIGLIMPVMPDLIREVGTLSLANAALWGAALTTIFAVMQFLCGPTIGSLSDRYGRRPVLLISLAVMAFDYILMAVAGTITLLIIGRIIGGITAATQSTAAAYMADISKPEDKAANFGLIGAAFGIGFVLGPLIGGLLATYGTRAPFYAAAALAAANFAFGYFILPETVTDKIRRPFSWKRANPIGAFKYIGQLPGLKKLLSIAFLYEVAFFVYPGVWAYYGIAQFGWGPGMIGVSLGAFGVSIALAQGLLIRPIIKAVGERSTVIIGLSISIGCFFVLGFLTNGWVAVALTPLSALGSIAQPALQGIMSRTAADDQQGELQGALSSIKAIATILSPMLVGQTFWYFTNDNAPVFAPGAPFLMSGMIMAGCIGIFLTRPKGLSFKTDA